MTSAPGPPPSFAEKLLETAPVAINYAEGPANGPPVVLLHGIAKTWRDFCPLFPAFESWQVFALDLRGHGKSGRVPHGYRSGAYASDVIAFLKKRLREPPVIFGHSLGGLIAMRIAATHPESTRGIIVGDTSLSRDTLAHSMYQALFIGLHQIVLQGGTVREMAERLARLEISVPGIPDAVLLGDLRTNNEAALLEWAASLQQVDPEAMQATVEGNTFQDFDSTSVLRAIRCPTLILQANPELGGLMPDGVIATIVRQLPQARVARFPLLGHELYQQRAQPIIDVVLPFLNDISKIRRRL